MNHGTFIDESGPIRGARLEHLVAKEARLTDRYVAEHF